MQLLLGGLITLAVTAVVQILIIPWVQYRNRQRERWERDLVELIVLVDEDLREQLQNLTYCLQDLFDLRDRLEELDAHGEPSDSSDRRVAKEDLKAAMDHLIELWGVLQNLHVRESHLIERVSLLGSRSPVWDDLRRAHQGLRTDLLRIIKRRRGPVIERGEIGSYEAYRSQMSNALVPLRRSMRPPRGPARRKTIARLLKRRGMTSGNP